VPPWTVRSPASLKYCGNIDRRTARRSCELEAFPAERLRWLDASILVGHSMWGAGGRGAWARTLGELGSLVLSPPHFIALALEQRVVLGVPWEVGWQGARMMIRF
jgi:hypothetical protein